MKQMEFKLQGLLAGSQNKIFGHKGSQNKIFSLRLARITYSSHFDLLSITFALLINRHWGATGISGLQLWESWVWECV